jgi:hypothetical protein
MKVILIVAGLISFVAAQTLSDLPVCSKACLQEGFIHTGCAFTDVECACAHAAFISDDISPCLQSIWSDEALNNTTYLVDKICANVVVPIPPIADQINMKNKFTGMSSLPFDSPTRSQYLTSTFPIPRTPHIRLLIPPDSHIGRSTTTEHPISDYTVIIVPATSTTGTSRIVHILTLTHAETQTQMHTQTQTKTQTVAVTSTVVLYLTPFASVIDSATATSSISSTAGSPEDTSGVGSVRVGGLAAGIVEFVGLLL